MSDPLEHVLTALRTYEQVTAAPAAGEAWKRSARMNLERELANYQHTSEASTIEELRALLREILNEHTSELAAWSPELVKKMREAIGEELKQPKG